jgi:transcriptional regulator with PAS, ATPase and Fis domain
MSPAVQAKLLRVLEEREFQRLGGTKVLKTDARIVAATNRDLARAIEKGEFREDLFYRLSVFGIHLPPLRERPEDILPLTEMFLAELGPAVGRPVPGISREAKELLLSYPWPGNVRELRNAAQRLVVLDADGRITAEDLSGALRRGVDVPHEESAPWPLAYSRALDRALHEFRNAYVTRLLEVHGGNVSRAAATAGVSRRTLHRWLADLNASAPKERT